MLAAFACSRTMTLIMACGGSCFAAVGLPARRNSSSIARAVIGLRRIDMHRISFSSQLALSRRLHVAALHVFACCVEPAVGRRCSWHLQPSVAARTLDISASSRRVHVAAAQRQRQTALIAAAAEDAEEFPDDGEVELDDLELEEFEDFDEESFLVEGSEAAGVEDWAAEGAVADASGAMINTGKVDWGQVGLTIARRILEARPDLELFALRAVAARRRLDIAIDKPGDRFGSPTSDDLDAFVRDFNRQYEAALGEELAADIAVEVSSPGAERAVRVPQDLERFRELPMTVVYQLAAADGATSSSVQEKVLMLLEVDEAAATVRWNLADVRVNREAQGKGRRLGKKKLQEVFEMPFASIVRVNLHLDI